MADNNVALQEYGIGQVFNLKVQDELADYVKCEYDRAKRHKEATGINDRLLKCLRSKLCEYAPEDADMVDGIDIFVGIGALKQRAAESWLIDIIVNNIEKPWTLAATPEPDLPLRLKEKVVSILIQELPEIASMEALVDRITQLKAAVTQISQQQAERTTARMESKISDQLAEGNWNKTFTQFVNQLTTYPAAILRGPIEKGCPVAKWNNDKLEVTRGSVLSVRTVSPFDAFPAPNSTSASNGSYFIERTDMSPDALHSMIGVKSFNDTNIRATLDKYQNGYDPDSIEKTEERLLKDRDSLASQDNNLDIETLIYNGKIPGKLLIKAGVLVQDPQKHYECEVWVCGDITIRAVLNPNPLGKRPLYSTNFVKIDGKFWGKGVIDLVMDTERICNAACRDIVRNMGFSAGPIGEAISDRIADGDDPSDLRPYKIFRVGPDITGTGAPAFKFHNVGIVAGELMRVFEGYMKLADDLSGVPAYVLGNPQVAGAGRTLGGLSMLMGNAAKGIKQVQLNIDMDIISGVVEAFYMYNMLMSDDMSIKADAKVVARGATGLLQRELAQTRTVELLQLMTPYVQARLVDKAALTYLFREIFKTTGIDIDKIFPDPDQQAGLEELFGLLGGQAEAFNRGMSGAPELPPQSVPQQMPQMASIPTPVNLAQGA